MPHAYTEDQLVEQPAIGMVADPGWTTVSVLENMFRATGRLLGEAERPVLFVARMRAAAKRLGPALRLEAIPTSAAELICGPLLPRLLWRGYSEGN